MLIRLGWLRIGVTQRNEQRERAALAWGADDLDLAAEEARDFPADRKSEPSATVFTIRRAIGLLERFEDQLLLVLRNADTRVLHLERDGIGAVEAAARKATAFVDPPDGQRDPPPLGVLERVRRQGLNDT